jgi:Flp pilus assembly protein TadG
MKRKLLRLAPLGRSESGTAAVEFAIVSSVFITFVTGIAYASIMLHSNATLQWAVESAARQASLDPDITENQLQTAVNNMLTQMKMPSATVNYSVAPVNGVPVATVSASFTRSFTLPFVDTFDTTYTATARTPQNEDS